MTEINRLADLIQRANAGGKSNITPGMEMTLGVLLTCEQPALTASEIVEHALSLLHTDADAQTIKNASKPAGGLASLWNRGVISKRKVRIPGEGSMAPGKAMGHYRSGMIAIPAFKNYWFIRERTAEVRAFAKDQRALAIQQWPETEKRIRREYSQKQKDKAA